LSDRILIAENRCAAFFGFARVTGTQKPVGRPRETLTSPTWTSPLSRASVAAWSANDPIASRFGENIRLS
jgi:hypothetical protein